VLLALRLLYESQPKGYSLGLRVPDPALAALPELLGPGDAEVTAQRASFPWVTSIDASIFYHHVASVSFVLQQWVGPRIDWDESFVVPIRDTTIDFWPVPVFFHPIHPLRAGRPYLMSRVIVPPKEASKQYTQNIDFSDQMASGETITSTTVSCTVYSGVDPTPSAVLGSTTVSGQTLNQVLTGGVAGVIYQVVLQANTSASQQLIKSFFLAIVPPLT